jgi:hypothetical protein
MAGELLPVFDPIFFCRNPEQFGDGSNVHLLDTKRPTWFLVNTLPWMAHAELERMIQTALDGWSKVADVQATKAATPEAANFLITTATLDGPGGVLADMQLPAPGIFQQRMRIDIAEAALRDKLPLILMHEFGHAYGLQHFPMGPPPELMEPILNPSIAGPQPTEANLMAKWYGLPIPPSPAPGVPGVAPVVCTMKLEPGTDLVKCDISVQQGSKKAQLSGSKPW